MSKYLMEIVKKLNKSFNPFVVITFILIASCTNESHDPSDEKVLERINLVCEGEKTRKVDYKWQSTEPDKRVYRFVRTENQSYLYGFGPGPNPGYYGVNIDDEKISLVWESEKDQDGHFHYNSININRFTGDVKDWYVIESITNSENIFEGSCKAQDQKF